MRVKQELNKKLNKMTCKDCIHYHSIGTLCDKYIYPEERNNNACDHYGIEVDADAYRICAEMVSKDGTYYNGTEHCPKCGKHVPQWGLCDECDSWESISK